MTSSPDTEALPPALSSMWRLCKLGYRHEPRLMLAAFVLSQLAALPDALLALWLMLLGKGVLENRPGLVRAAAIGLAVSVTGTWFLATVSTRVQRHFRDKVTIALESHVARLQASVTSIAHQERPEYLDQLAMLRDQVFRARALYMSVFSTFGWILTPRCDGGAARHDPSCARAARVFALRPCSRHVAPAARTRRSRTCRAGQSPGPSLVYDRDHGAHREGSPGHRIAIAWWPNAARPGSAHTRRCRRPDGLGNMHNAGLGVFASRTSARWCSCRQRLSSPSPVAGSPPRRPPGARRRESRCPRNRRDGVAKLDSCAASGWMVRRGSPGSKTTAQRL